MTMLPNSKKRRPNEDTAPTITASVPPPSSASPLSAVLTKDDVFRIIEPLSRDQLAEIVASATCHGGLALDLVRSLCGRDVAQRKLFIRGLGWDTTQESLRSIFSPYGELEEAVVISDKATGKSKGYGFITFRHADGAVLALKDPSKKIDGRITVVQLASAGLSEKSAPNSALKAADLALRKIFVGNVLPDMSSERLLSHFATYGEIEEGPLGFDKQTGKFRGFALFVYKTVGGAQAALASPNKVFDGHTLVCKLAGEGKKGKAGGGSGAPEPGPVATSGQTQRAALGSDFGGSGVGLSVPGQYGGFSAGLSSYFGTAPGLSSYGGTGISSGGGYLLPGAVSGTPGPKAGIGSLSTTNSGGGLGLGALGPATQYGSLPSLGLSSGSGMLAKMGLGNLGILGVNRGVGLGGGFVDAGSYPFRGPDSQMQVGLCLPSGAPAGFQGGPGLHPNLPPYY